MGFNKKIFKDIMILYAKIVLLLFILFLLIIAFIQIKTLKNPCYELAKSLIVEEENCLHFSKEVTINRLLYNSFEVLNELKNEGWKIVITNKPMKEVIAKNNFTISNPNLPHKNIIGLTSYNDKTIYLNHKYSNIISATNHEIGHALNHYLYMPTKSEKFKEIFQLEKHSMSKHVQSSEIEFWAEVYSQTIEPMSFGEKKYPEASKYILENIENINKKTFSIGKF